MITKQMFSPHLNPLLLTPVPSFFSLPTPTIFLHLCLLSLVQLLDVPHFLPRALSLPRLPSPVCPMENKPASSPSALAN